VEALLTRVLVELGVLSAEEAGGALARATRLELAGALRDFVASLEPLHAFPVLIVDAAHEVGGDVLEPFQELIAALPLQLMLVGDPSLVRILRGAGDRGIGGVRCTLQPLTRDEIARFVEHRLDVGGARGHATFDPDAWAPLFGYSRGLPRLVNLICDRALAEGHLASAATIDARLIDAAAASLGLVGSSRAAGLARTIALAGGFALLALLGAALAAVALRSRVEALLDRW
jgi:general secretion pathway protein A